MLHNSETDAADLLMEIERLDLLVKAVDSKTYRKVAHYLKSCVPYAPGTEITRKEVDNNIFYSIIYTETLYLDKFRLRIF